jgi:hypothetical protein
MRKSKAAPLPKRRSNADQQIIGELLAPIFVLLRKSGLTEHQITAELVSARARAAQSRSRIKVVKQQEIYNYSEVVDTWLKDPSYATTSGRPMDLPLAGQISISNLIKLTRITHPPKVVLAVLKRFGIVRKTAAGNYRLVKLYMELESKHWLVFEPHLAFLTEAVKAATRGMASSRRQPTMFWISIENRDIPLRVANEFKLYVRERGRVFLREVDDWLRQHAVDAATTTNKRKQLRRLGVGLFPFCTDR